jgi:hypothetical protein
MAILACCLYGLPPRLVAAEPDNGPATRAVYLDTRGIVRWRDNGEEVALFGANYCVMSGSDYRMAGLLGKDRKAMIDEDLAQFARMGWTALRLCSWGDWENSDREGNLVVNEHVDLLDYLIARARERGIYLLLTPIHTYDPAYADQMNQPTQNVGFSRYFQRNQMGTDPASIAAQARYIGQLLRHVNRYSGVALKDEPALLFIELINEPVHHPEDRAGSVRYINTLVKAVRDTGTRKLTFFNLSQDFAIGQAIHDSKVDGLSFGWYPTSLVAGHQLRGNFLPSVDAYPELLRADLANRPRLVYEFDQADLLSGYLYPAMARTFRSVGAQLATMFAYDMLQTAPFNLGWQTHYLNLVHTPRKAISAVIAAEAMRRLPSRQGYGAYPQDTAFGDFRVSYEQDASLLNADDAFMNAGDTSATARNPAALQRIAGLGSSGTVSYEGSGAYFLDKLSDGLWRLEVYPDEVMVRDPFEQPQPDKIVSRLLYRHWPIGLNLPDLGTEFLATPITLPGSSSTAARHASAGSVAIEPGVWLFSKGAAPERSALPAQLHRVGFDEYHVNERQSYPDLVLSLTPQEFVAGAPLSLRVRVANDVLPDQVRLWVRAAGTTAFGPPVDMRRERGNDYVAPFAADALAPGLYEYAVSTQSGARVTSFPGGVAGEPHQWPFRLDRSWTLRITPPGTAIRLFNPRTDYAQLSFVRPGEQYRDAFFRLSPGNSSDESALTLDLPELGRDTPARYAAALYIGDVLAAHASDAPQADALQVTLRADHGTRKSLEITLVEKDGTAWSTTVQAGAEWARVRVPLASLRAGRSIHIPSPYPGLWNYWRASAQGRGGNDDRPALAQLERLQLTVMPNQGERAGEDASGVSVQSVELGFAPH